MDSVSSYQAKYPLGDTTVPSPLHLLHSGYGLSKPLPVHFHTRAGNGSFISEITPCSNASAPSQQAFNGLCGSPAAPVHSISFPWQMQSCSDSFTSPTESSVYVIPAYSNDVGQSGLSYGEIKSNVWIQRPCFRWQPNGKLSKLGSSQNSKGESMPNAPVKLLVLSPNSSPAQSRS